MREELKVDVGKLKKVDGIPEDIGNDKQLFGWYYFPYVAIPISVGRVNEEQFLMKGDGESLAGIYYGSYGEVYHVYQIRLHKKHIECMAEKLFDMGGFFLVEK